MSTSIVTGGAGFIGSHLIQALVARGDRVVCIEAPEASPRWLSGLPVEYHYPGIGDTAQLAPLFKGADVVFHLAGLTAARSPSDYYRVNSEGTRAVMQAAAAQGDRPPVVVLLSSLAALGPCRDSAPLDAETLPCPLSHYGQSKLLAEAAVHAYADRVPAVILRFSAVYGPRERGVLQFFRMVARGLALTTGSWDREVSMIYVADAVEALICAARAPGAVGRTFCVAHPDPVSWGGFADATAEALGRRPLRIALPVPLAQLVAVVAECTALIAGRPALLNREKLRELVQQRWVCDVTRAMRELRFEPAWPVIRGTATTAAWYRAARWL